MRRFESRREGKKEIADCTSRSAAVRDIVRSDRRLLARPQMKYAEKMNLPDFILYKFRTFDALLYSKKYNIIADD